MRGGSGVQGFDSGWRVQGFTGFWVGVSGVGVKGKKIKVSETKGKKVEGLKIKGQRCLR